MADSSDQQDAVPAAVQPTGRRGFATSSRMSGVGLAARRGLGSAGGLASLSDKYARRSAAKPDGDAPTDSPPVVSGGDSPGDEAAAAGNGSSSAEGHSGGAGGDSDGEDDPSAAIADDGATEAGSDSASLAGSVSAAAANAGGAESGGRDLSNSSEGAPPQEVQRSDSSRRLSLSGRLRATKQVAAQGRRAARRKAKE